MTALFPSRALLAGLVLMAVAAPDAIAFNALHSFDFNAAGNTEGWTPANATVTASNGTTSGTATAVDPQFARSGFNFPGNASSGLLIRYRGSDNGNVQLFWGRSGADNYSATRVVTLDYSGNGGWRTLFLSPKGHPDWDDRTITRLRLDPAGPSASSFEIDWLRVLSWDSDNDGVPDPVEGGMDSDGDGLLDLEDLDSNGDRMPDDGARAISNAPGSVRFDFNDDTNTEGWTTGGNLNSPGVGNGALEAEVTGLNPELVRARLHLQAALHDGLVVRIHSPVPGNITLYWTHDAPGGESFDIARSMTIAVPANPDYARSVYLDLRAATDWKGKLITSLRLDPDFLQGTVFSIDSILTAVGGAKLIVDLVGFVYPAYMSFKSMDSGNQDDTQWLTYWVVFSCFSIVESFMGFVVALIPFYFWIKIAAIVYMWHPTTRGAQTIYEQFLRPIMLPYLDSDKATTKKAE